MNSNLLKSLPRPADEKDHQIARILMLLIWATLAAYVVVFVSSLYYGERNVIFITAVGSVLQLSAFCCLRRGRLLATSWILSVGTLGTLTLLATFGQGYRDFAIFGFPVLLVFTSMTLNRTVFITNLLLMCASITWLVFGQMSGWFRPVAPGEGTYWPDFFVLMTILLVAAFAIDILVKNMRRNLELAQSEITRRKAAEEILKEANIEKETLLRILSHDLVNLISSGRQAMTLMAEDPEGFSETETRAIKAQVAENLSEASKLIDLSRQLIAIESGKIKMDLVRGDIVQTVRETCDIFRPGCNKKRLLIELETPDFLLCSKMEPTIFKHTILGNLVSNAVKFSYEGQLISIRIKKMGSDAVVAISNIGPPIPEERMKTLFMLTARTSTPGTSGEKGTGLGLPLVAKFISLMEGSVLVDSRPVSGQDGMFVNTFTLRLPV